MGTPYHLVPWTCLIDSNEQAPYRFSALKGSSREGHKPLVLKVERRNLKTGDYSIEGMERRVAVERKSPEDCLSTLTRGRDRFQRELERMQEMEFAAVVVEAEWSKLLSDVFESKANRNSILGSVIAYQQRYPKTHWMFMPSRVAAEAVTFRILDRFWREQKKPN